MDARGTVAFQRILLISLSIASLASVPACTSTRIKKDPGDHDKGIRYYRPKPYLLVQPLAVKTDDGDLVSKGMVTMELKYLPDYSEEYSIHVRAGLGVNKTSVKLQDGWNLTDINIEVDSKTAENLTALSGFVNALGVGRGSGAKEYSLGVKVPASNVPLGYYESIIGRAKDGKKRLYGWRYVGFTPYENCPVDGVGGPDCFNCSTQGVYGMVSVNGVMTFAPLPDIAEGTVSDPTVAASRNDTVPPPPMAGAPAAAVSARPTASDHRVNRAGGTAKK